MRGGGARDMTEPFNYVERRTTEPSTNTGGHT